VNSLWDIVKTVGGNLISTAVPGGPLLLAGINALLPDDAQLPADATGQQAQDVISALPPEQRAEVMGKKFDVELATITQSGETMRAMLTTEATSPHTTRPKIALGSFRVVAFAIIVTISLWAYGIVTADTDMVKTIVNGWPFLLSAVGPLIVLLRAYFGVLGKEQKNKLDAATGNTNPAGIAGIIQALVKQK